jgi:two-component system sensor histidine kinase TctE
VRHGLNPFQRLRRQIADRSSHDLAPLDTHDVPLEVADLVQALNRLLTTLRESGEVQQSFLANAAHQLRTPLTGLQAQLELLIADERTDSIRERLAALRQGTQGMARTTHQLLTLARADPTANLRLHFTPVSLRLVIEQAVAVHLERAIAADIDLGVDIAPAVVVGSEWMLHELLANLLDNALIYTPRGGVITVCAATRAGVAVLEVEDNGPGISATERERVTERFYRGGGARGNGTGLGRDARVGPLRERCSGGIGGQRRARIGPSTPPLVDQYIQARQHE